MGTGKFGLLALGTLLAGLLAPPAEAAIIQVPDDYPTIQAGINAAGVGDTVLVACGTYFEHDIILKPGIHLLSEGGTPECVTIDGQGAIRVMSGGSGGALRIVEGFTLTNASGYYTAGPGFTCDASQSELRKVRICNTTNVDMGGAIFCGEGAALTMVECLVDSNATYFDLGMGGGAVLSFRASPTFVDCMFKDNYSENAGGGVSAILGAPQFIRCQFIGNTAGSLGGGLDLEACNAYLEDCEFRGNRADRGGGLGTVSDSRTTEMVRCAFLGNQARVGGAIYCSANYPDDINFLGASNCTFSGNRATEAGGGIYMPRQAGVDIGSSILWGNCAPNGAELWVGHAGTTLQFLCCDLDMGDGWYAGPPECLTLAGVFSSDPLFCDPMDCAEAPSHGGDFRLALGSSCLPEGNGCALLVGAFGQGCEMPTSAEPGSPVHVPLGLCSHPNPFNPSTEIHFSLEQSTAVTLSAYDITGRWLTTLLDGERLAAGAHTVTWSGCDAEGRALPSGVYLYRLEAGDHHATEKLTLLR